MAAFRWAALVWSVAVVLFNRDKLVRPGAAVVVLLAALAVTMWTTPLAGRGATEILRPAVAGAELAVAVALSLLGGWVYESGTAFSTTLALGSPWIVASVIAVGVVAGPRFGALAGVALGAARLGAALLNDTGTITPSQWLTLASTTVAFVLPGALAGTASRFGQRYEQELANARAREDIGRTLHDGVLQTLAVIERRSDDPELQAIAREQERELREYLFGGGNTAEQGGAAELGPRLREHAARFERAYGGRVDVVLPLDLPHAPPTVVDALNGAVGEALTNAGKHGAAGRVVVYVEPARGGLECSVHDDGGGFEPDAVEEGVGLSRSIRARIEEAGGTVEIESRNGAGTEVRMWLPT